MYDILYIYISKFGHFKTWHHQKIPVMMCHACCYTKPRILLESLQGPGGARVSCIDVNPQVVFLSKRCQMVPTGFKFTSIYHILQEKIGTPWTLLVFYVNFQPSNNGIFETSVSFAKSLKEAISSVPRWPLRCRSWCYHAHGGWYLQRNQRNYERIEIIIGQDSKWSKKHK